MPLHCCVAHPLVFALLAAASGAYYLLACVAALRMRANEKPAPARRACPAVSILKPVRGRDEQFYEAIRSHATQDYPEFEILFGVSDPDDPAIADIERLQAEFPRLRIACIRTHPACANGKVGTLAEVVPHARHGVLLINDSDILVEPDYLRRVTAPLEDPKVGVVTALYRARATSWAGRWEAIGIATEFAPSVLVARLVGVVEFALGSTMVVRREQLEAIGGFAALGDYIADDYQLGHQISALGYLVAFAPVVVQTHLGAPDWAGVWRHQLRWSRTIKVSRTGGYLGYAVTHATVWSLGALIAGYPIVGGVVMALRMTAGLLTGVAVLRDRQLLRDFWLIPLRDLLGFAVWCAGLFGATVEWRGLHFRVQRDGRMAPVNGRAK